ncbi:nucleoid occlusion protein [Syntrophomonas erecta]
MRKKLEKILGVSSQGKVVNIPLDRIQSSPYQPRRNFDARGLEELAQSIEAYGVIQPIIVRQIDGDLYQLVAGERRLRACSILGRDEIPAIIQDMNDEKAAAISLIENLQRRELNYFEEANAYSVLINSFGMTQEEVAKKIGRSQSAIANKMRLLKLPETVRCLITPSTISERHARALLKLNSAEMQMEVLRQVYEKELTVKETEKLVEELSRHNIPREEKRKENGQQNVSMIIRDARIFINTIKETVKRARQTGVEISVVENDSEDTYKMVIHINKQKRTLDRIAQG